MVDWSGGISQGKYGVDWWSTQHNPRLLGEPADASEDVGRRIRALQSRRNYFCFGVSAFRFAASAKIQMAAIEKNARVGMLWAAILGARGAAIDIKNSLL